MLCCVLLVLVAGGKVANYCVRLGFRVNEHPFHLDISTVSLCLLTYFGSLDSTRLDSPRLVALLGSLTLKVPAGPYYVYLGRATYPTYRRSTCVLVWKKVHSAPFRPPVRYGHGYVSDARHGSIGRAIARLGRSGLRVNFNIRPATST